MLVTYFVAVSVNISQCQRFIDKTMIEHPLPDFYGRDQLIFKEIFSPISLELVAAVDVLIKDECDSYLSNSCIAVVNLYAMSFYIIQNYASQLVFILSALLREK